MEETIFGADSMYRHAADFVRRLVPGEAAIVVGLQGDLGAGKTTFFQGVAQALGVREHTTSPTFVIQKSYKLSGQPFHNLIHIDAYRLKEAHELEVLGWHDIVKDPHNLIFIEWPERVSGILPKNAVILKFRFIDEQTRGVERVTGV
ncbi:tRNA (adenosine(37)-N6)-threonylcarbamoyltransferase complex ATPase subunit type 1 TsaE [Candidatus Kaiserbacteria bacterium]|nr:tRNA (adenosine(37)-N6)-threonylcarbamoyltransferase complex ATPase subunit type 1 TsaE [Candidatus Kaiserbacteria bacterium]